MSDARKLFIDGPAGRLEAALREAAGPRALAVLSHPHPLYGGTLDNPVIFHADRELNRAGLTTLRFNFRGVQGSDGFHDDGRGEIEDVAAAASYLRSLHPVRAVPLLLVGYSFGSRCSVYHALNDPTVAGVVAIGLPLRIWNFDDVLTLGRPIAVIQGSDDEFASPAEVRAFLERTTPPGTLCVVDGTGHLFPGRAAEAAERVVGATEWVLEAASR